MDEALSVWTPEVKKAFGALAKTLDGEQQELLEDLLDLLFESVVRVVGGSLARGQTYEEWIASHYPA